MKEKAAEAAATAAAATKDAAGAAKDKVSGDSQDANRPARLPDVGDHRHRLTPPPTRQADAAHGERRVRRRPGARQ